MIDFLKLRASMPSQLQMDLPSNALNRWNPSLRAEGDESENTITIYDVIGQDFWGEGVTAKRIGGALRAIGSKNPVTVYVNSPGGDMFEGIAIHNQLAEHRGPVTIKVLGLAASAASVIAMAGNEVQMLPASFMMIHNAWMVGVGNKEAFRELADWLEPFDSAIADLYAKRTNQEKSSIQALMKKEIWMGASDAVEEGFADQVVEDTATETDGDDQVSSRAALRQIDKAMAKGGVPRTKRRELLNALQPATPGAGRDNGTPSAADVSELVSLTQELRGIFNERN